MPSNHNLSVGAIGKIKGHDKYPHPCAAIIQRPRTMRRQLLDQCLNQLIVWTAPPSLPAE